MAEMSQAECQPQTLVLAVSLKMVFRYFLHTALSCSLPQTEPKLP